MKYTGTLDGRAVYYEDRGFNACVWMYEDTNTMKRDRKAEQAIALGELLIESPEEPYRDNVKSAWREAYQEVPTEKVNPNDVPRIVTPGMHDGEEALYRALKKNPY